MQEFDQKQEKDALLGTLVTLSHYYNRPISAQSLLTGLPLTTGKLSLDLFTRAAEKAGLMAEIVEKPLNEISELVLPVVLILDNDDSCLLNRRIDAERAEIILPGESLQTHVIPIERLIKRYTGTAIYIKPLDVHKRIFAKDTVPLNKKKHWFWGTLWRFRAIYAEVMLGAFLINVFTITVPLFTMNVYDRVIPNNALITLWTLSIGMFIILAFDLLLRSMRSYLIDVIGRKADVLIAGQLFSQTMNMKLINKPHSTGAFADHLHQFEVVREFFTSATLTTIIDIPFAILFVFMIAYISFALAMVPIFLISSLILFAWLVEKPLRSAVQESIRMNAQKNGVLLESLTGIETIKSLNAQNVSQHKWEQLVAAVSRLGLKSRFFSGLVVNVTYVSQQLASILIIILGVYEINENKLTMGGLIACSILAGRAVGPVSQLANLVTRFQQARIAYTTLDTVMSMETERDLHKHYLLLPSIQGHIEFRDVTFQYPHQMQKALDRVSFKITPGEHVAILGRIGSGKTTVCKLLLNLYQPQQGAIFIDGIDINQLDPVDLRHYIGYVLQDSLLFAGTARDNIIFGTQGYTDTAIINAAKITGAHAFISQHPSGYDLPIGERGEGLSGGQRQLLAITRALVRNTPILILDEPTSSVDESLELNLIRNLIAYCKGKSLIVITHKASLINLVDRIILMDAGKIVMDGPKEKVLEKISRPQPQ